MDAPRHGPPKMAFLETLKKSVGTRSTWCPGHSRETTRIEKYRWFPFASTLVGERIGSLVKGSGRLKTMVQEGRRRCSGLKNNKNGWLNKSRQTARIGSQSNWNST